MTISMYILLVLAFILANLPFLNNRLLCVFKLQNKQFAHCLFEWFVYFFLLGIIAYILESSISKVHSQNGIFFTVVLCMFAVFSFPGFVWKYLWKR